MSEDFNDLSGGLIVYPRQNKLTGKVSLIAVGDSDIPSSMVVHNVNDLPSSASIYSDHVIDTIGFPPVYGNQRKSRFKILDRSNLSSVLKIAPHNKMSALVDIIQPPRVKLDLSPIKDAFAREIVPTLNYGTDQTMLVGYDSSIGDKYRSFIGFDVSSIPNNAIITKAILHLYNTSEVSKRLSIYTAYNSWTELGVTWRNQPYVNSFVTSTDVALGHYEVDVQSTIESWHSGEEVNNGFIIKATDESIDSLSKLTTREKQTDKPYLEIQYYEDIVYSFGRLELDSSMQVVGLGDKDITSSFEVRNNNSANSLSSGLHVFSQDMRESFINIVRSFVNTSLKVRLSDKKEVNGTLTIRTKGISDLDTYTAASAVIRKGSIYIPYTDNKDSSITIRRSDISSVDASFSVSRQDAVSSINIPYRDDLQSSFDVRAKANSQLGSSFSVSKYKVNGSITVRKNANSNLDSNLVIRRLAINQFLAKLDVSRPDLVCGLKPVLSSYMDSSFTVRATDKSQAQSSLTVLYRSDLPSSFRVTGASMLPSGIYVLSGYLKSGFTIPIRAFKDINVGMTVKAKFINEIASTVRVSSDYVGGGFIFII